MSRSPARFTEADITRVLKAAQKAGFALEAVDITPDGGIKMTPKGAGNNGDSFEQWQAQRQARRQA